MISLAACVSRGFPWQAGVVLYFLRGFRGPHCRGLLVEILENQILLEVIDELEDTSN